jgi:hypothetical protein
MTEINKKNKRILEMIATSTIIKARDGFVVYDRFNMKVEGFPNADFKEMESEKTYDIYHTIKKIMEERE